MYDQLQLRSIFLGFFALYLAVTVAHLQAKHPAFPAFPAHGDVTVAKLWSSFKKHLMEAEPAGGDEWMMTRFGN